MRVLASALVVAVVLLGSQAAWAEKEPDHNPPVFHHVPVTSATQGDEVTISTEIEDESDIFAPLLWYRYPGTATYSSTDLVHKTGKLWSATIPAPEAGIDYWLEAYDGLGNGPAREGSPDQPFHIAVKEKPPVYKEPQVMEVKPDASAPAPQAEVKKETPTPAVEAAPAPAPAAEAAKMQPAPAAPVASADMPKKEPLVVAPAPSAPPQAEAAPVAAKPDVVVVAPSVAAPAPIGVTAPPLAATAEAIPPEKKSFDPTALQHTETPPSHPAEEQVNLKPPELDASGDLTKKTPSPDAGGLEQPPAVDSTPIYKKWWAITGATVVVGAVVGVLVYALQPTTVEQNVFSTSLRRP